MSRFFAFMCKSGRLRRMRNPAVLLALGVPIVFGLPSACSVSTATPEEDSQAKAEHPEAGRALVYVYRDGEASNSGYQNFFVVGDRRHGSAVRGSNVFEIKDDTYYLFTVPAGLVTFTSVDTTVYATAGCGGANFDAGDAIHFNAPPGSTSYIRVTAQGAMLFFLFYGQRNQYVSVEQVPESVGRAGLARARLIKSVECNASATEGTLCFHPVPPPPPYAEPIPGQRSDM